jgi:hypothetical protein
LLSWGCCLLVIVGLLGNWRWFVLGVVLVGWLVSSWLLSKSRMSETTLAGAYGAIAAAMAITYYPDWPGGLGGALLVVGTLAAPVSMELSIPVLAAKNLGGRRLGVVKASSLFSYAAYCTCWLAVAGATRMPSWSFAAVSVVVFAVTAVLTAVQVMRNYRNVMPRQISTLVKEHAPRWAIHFTGAPEEAFQIEMWLPYLERTQEPYVIIIREAECFDPVAKLTKAPVLLAQNLRGIEMALPESVRTIFYVNNNARNVNAVHFSQLTHVALGHGDSEKPSSYRKSFAMFDQIFVAGQAGIDRFARHGVSIPPEKFRIVGRPQLDELEISGPISGPPIVLYAPTWRGGVGEMEFGSLSMGEEIVSALLEFGSLVVFRPHPLSLRDADTRVYIKRIDALLADGDHQQSTDTMKLSLADCINASTALVSDLSSVVSDYLFTTKPFALTDVNGLGEAELTKILPMATGAYLLPSGPGLRPALKTMLLADNKLPERLRLKEYYLGNFPADDYTDVFVKAAKAAIDGGSGLSV